MRAGLGGRMDGRGGTARTKVARRDWIEAAYRELARAGERGVAITALAARLGVTKGSFYWHFTDRGELMAALLDRWAHERTDEMLGLALGSTADPRERLRRIQALGRDIAPVDRAMRLWAQHEPAAEEAVRHADRALLGHISACLEQLGCDPDDARLRALLMLRAWAGGYLVPSPPGDDARMLDLLLPDPPVTES
ncbi:TetR/AcrR family transcriptional regulator [Actinomadura parmotrematis]|uniref:TetR/AcrR family transcriptional regulator n=1 Tax=Actinomadura parmotrematis TaxID=2864039 RepID=A0ABS7G139_9ACTN|nr:TetR/AcrR family transcriptional regulator [Actinomadura parmotrematis]MBW8485925.1 TetR/AcrR family transcriptional regulator [Actinomadura parmotrematis]